MKLHLHKEEIRGINLHNGISKKVKLFGGSRLIEVDHIFQTPLLDNLRFISYLLYEIEFNCLWRLYRRLDKGLFLTVVAELGILGSMYDVQTFFKFG